MFKTELDSAIHWVNYYQWISIKEISCAIHWIEIYPVDSIIYPSNNWGQVLFSRLPAQMYFLYRLSNHRRIFWGQSFIIIADRRPRRQTFSHLLLTRSKSTLVLQERILKLMLQALYDSACNTVLLKLTVIYSIGYLQAFSNRGLVFIVSYSHASQLISNFVLGFLSYSSPGPGSK